jgi:signal transduction histidine kinase
MRLFWKVYLLSLFSLVFCTVLLTAIVSIREADRAHSRLHAEQRVLAITAASQVETGYYDEVWPFEMLSGIAREAEFVTWQIVDGSGRIVLSDTPTSPIAIPDPGDVREPMLLHDSEDAEVWIVPMRMRDGARPWQFRLAYRTDQIRAQLRATVRTNALIAFGLAIAFLGSALVITRRMLRPLDSLTHAVGALERGTLEVALPRAGKDEIGRLVAGFSAMVGSIRERDAKIQEQLESLEAARADLERRVEERTAELQASQARLVDASRQAGMAEVASNVLHNVGNVLNSVNVSASVIRDRLVASKVAQVAKVSTLLKDHEGDLAGYLTGDPRGKLVPRYLSELGPNLEQERDALLGEVTSLTENIEHIKRVVATQQTFARHDIDVGEVVVLESVIEDALRISSHSSTDAITVARELAPVPKVRVDRHKLIHILVNLVNNAKQAVAKRGDAARVRLVLAPDGENDAVRIEVVDNGVGIPPANLARIFNHGFTTKPDGHGFGLHSAALSAKEMGGSLAVSSDGEDRGARFTLVVPVERTRASTAPLPLAS